MKRPQLGEADKRAVDMLFDHLPTAHLSSSTSATGSLVTFSGSDQGIVEPERLEAARRLLTRLDAYRVDDPPADLVARTMARIASTPLAPLSTDRSAGSDAPLSRPQDHSLDT